MSLYQIRDDGKNYKVIKIEDLLGNSLDSVS